MAVERHLRRVADRLPEDAGDLLPASDASDAVVLHLWQATQIVIDQAMAACLTLKLGAPASYADAFRRLREAGVIGEALAERLIKAAGFRNVVARTTTRSTCVVSPRPDWLPSPTTPSWEMTGRIVREMTFQCSLIGNGATGWMLSV